MTTETPILKPFTARQSEQLPEKPKIFQAIDNLIEGNWPFILEAAGDATKYNFDIKVELDRRAGKSFLKLGIAFSRRYKDSAEFWIEDPNQGELPLEPHDGPLFPEKGQMDEAFALPEQTEQRTEPLALPEHTVDVMDAEFTEVTKEEGAL